VYDFAEPRSGWRDETQTAKLIASDGAAGDSLGSSVAISSDTVAAGAFGATVNGHANQGAVYVFGSPWGVLTASVTSDPRPSPAARRLTRCTRYVSRVEALAPRVLSVRSRC
jgi:FG-GAP repeat